MTLRTRRGTEAQRLTITPLEGEPIYTTDTKKLYIGDGTTVGGVEVTDAENLPQLPSLEDTYVLNVDSSGDGTWIADPNADIPNAPAATGEEVQYELTVPVSGNPTWEVAAAGTNTVNFISTQAAYDARIWASGDLFTPIGTISVSVPGTQSEYILSFNGNIGSSEVSVTGLIGTNAFFSSSTLNEATTLTFSDGLAAFSMPFIRQLTGTTTIDVATGNTPNNKREFTAPVLLAQLINSISITGTQILQNDSTNGAILTRNCTARTVGGQLILTRFAVGTNSITNITTLPTDWESRILVSGNTTPTTYPLVSNSLYIRNANNDGWIESNVPINAFIES